MTRRKLSASLALFLFATLVLAILVFFIGQHQGYGRASAATPAAAMAAYSLAETTEAAWSCDSFGGFHGLRGNMSERACDPARRVTKPWTPPEEYAAGAHSGKPLYGRPGGPLQQAATSAILDDLAGGAHAGPAGLLDAPAAPALAALPGGGGSPIYNGPPGSFIGGPGLPGALPPGASLPPPGGEIPPPTAEVPLPGAFPFLLTGLAGMAAVRRRRRRG